jgi:hypothetical protein
MNATTYRIITAALFVIVPVWLFVNWTILGFTFDIPFIQYREPWYILQRFNEGGKPLLYTWILLLTPGVLFVPAVLMLNRYLQGPKTPYLGVAAAFGVTAWVLQFFGVARWMFVVPLLAEKWAAAGSDQATRTAAEMVLMAFNQFAGFALGQYIGLGINAFWLALVGWAMLSTPIFNPWMGRVALLSGILLFIGDAAPLGTTLHFPFGWILVLNLVSTVATYLMYGWMIAIALVLLRLPRESDEAAQPSAPLVAE